VLGWGEISQVAEIEGLAVTGWRHPRTGRPMAVVYKKMPPFLDRGEAEAFVARYLEYNAALRDRVGIEVPHFDARLVQRGERTIVFVVQERVDPAAVGHLILRDAGPGATESLCRLVFREYEKLYRFHQGESGPHYRLGLDGQIPNWAVAGYRGDPEALTLDDRLVYLDTNVPMIRIDGRDVVSTDMYFQALPGLAKWIIKRLNLDQEVMSRYFDLRLILLDFLGNLIVRHRGDVVPRMIEVANEFLAGPLGEAGLAPYTAKEVQAYYRSDVSTWRLWRSLKLLGAVSDGISGGQWRVLRRLPEFYQIWTRPIF
jgi:hypothetical protein